MCGIVGFIGQGNKEILERMTESLRHRGPDDVGFFIKDNIYFGHRRLSIIDLKSGQQPIYNEDKSIVVVFNGEIYNFLELRKFLVGKNHQFSTKTDTEVLVHLYEEKGEEFLKELNGMFALALYDQKKQKLILARDRLGKKPLYWGKFGETLIFASELKAILAHPLVKRQINFQALAKYLIMEYVPTPLSIFENIYKLEGGHYLVAGKDLKIKIKKYWEISFDLKISAEGGSASGGKNFNNLLEELDQRLSEAVKIRLISDVPLGVFLSGGIDSSALVYYAQKALGRPVKTFSIGFTDQTFDESSYARKVAAHLSSDHHEQMLEAKDLLDLVPQIASFLDEPLGDASIVPVYLLSKFTRSQVTVALGGDGGDELFMGYQTFQAQKLAQIYGLIPGLLRRGLFDNLINRLPTSFDNISLDFQLKKFISGIDWPEKYRHLIWLGSFSPKELAYLFKPEIYRNINGANLFSEADDYWQRTSGENDVLHRIAYLYIKLYLQDDLLVKVDRASMANSLEVRAPLLDYTLVDFVNSLPAHYKIKGYQMKYLFKKVMAGKLPDEIIRRRKKGFGMPVAKWFRGELRDFCLDMLSERRITAQNIFNYNYIKNLLEEHFSGKKDNRKQLWTLVIFELWHEKWASSA
ncbi:MAG: asparagine synthase (glutamine-hydrolyzing) [bacterium]